jgi:hypothetical protein
MEAYRITNTLDEKHLEDIIGFDFYKCKNIYTAMFLFPQLVFCRNCNFSV